MGRFLIIARTISWIVCCTVSLVSLANAKQVELTILHTNDIHSHYQPGSDDFGLGGIARLATVIRRERAKAQHSLLFDGGDWSEGNIYYNLGTGRTAIEIMNALSYDAAVLGNHDWLNGPDQLIKLFSQTKPNFPVLAANVTYDDYANAEELQKNLLPYKILHKGPLKIGVIGLVTYELIYDKWLEPVRISSPFKVVKALSKKLKTEENVDLVVVISHNGLNVNKLVAAAQYVDIVVHAHDHLKLAEPVVVTRKDGKVGLIVEADEWGHYLGRLRIVVDTDKKTYALKDYELLQIDDKIPADPEITTMVNNYDRQLEHRYGNIFDDHMVDLKVDLRRSTQESLFGNVVSDAFRAETGADVAFEQIKLTSDGLYSGSLSTVNFMNALTAIYNPIPDKTWTLKTMKMTGDTLWWLMNFIVSIQSYTDHGLLNVSGMHMIYDHSKAGNTEDAAKLCQMLEADYRQKCLEANSPLKSIDIAGEPIQLNKYYKIAISQGLEGAIDFIESTFKNKIPRTDVVDTGLERWQVVLNYMKKNSPFTSDMVSRGKRMSILQPDLGIYNDDINVQKTSEGYALKVTVRNLGSTISLPRKIKVSYDETPEYTVDDPKIAQIEESYLVPAILAGEQATLNLTLKVPAIYKNKWMKLYVLLNRSEEDPNYSNDGSWIVVGKTPKKIQEQIIQKNELASARASQFGHDHED